MKTKAQIVQRLLEEKKIDAEEAVILLQDTSNQNVFIPYTPYTPYTFNPIITFSN